jgi:predicted Zn-dependent protease
MNLRLNRGQWFAWWLVLTWAILAALPAGFADEPGETRGNRRPSERPPPCPLELAARRRPAARPARTMPELFTRMGEQFARDPAAGFQHFIDQLEQLEGPALQGVTLSAAEERTLGRRAFDEYLRRAAKQGYPRIDDPKRLAYLNELVEGFARRMAHRDRYPRIDVALIDAPIAEGQSFPGGYLVFTTALLNEPDEATVAGVVAHELAHLDRGHLYEYARRSKLAEATYARPPGAPGNTFDQFFTRQMALLGLLMNPYRPEHEHQADCTAATWLYQEGYDPTALMRFFERMHARQRDVPANAFLNFGRSHPFTLDRREHVQARLRQLQRWKRRGDLGLFAENLTKLQSRFQEPEGR